MPSPLGKVRPSGNPSFASGKTGVLSILWPKYEDLQKVVGILPLPNGELFQVHGSKFKLHPVCYLSQACVSRLSHAMLFFGIRRDPFNGFLHRLQSPSLLRPARRAGCGAAGCLQEIARPAAIPIHRYCSRQRGRCHYPFGDKNG